MNTYFTQIIILITCLSCNEPTASLRKLSNQERYNRVQQGIFYDPKEVVWKNPSQHIISYNESFTFSRDSFYIDQYVDAKGDVKMNVIRPIQEEDKVFRQKTKELFDNNIDLQIKEFQATIKDSTQLKQQIALLKLTNAPIIAVDIDCNALGKMVEGLLETDQKNRGKQADHMEQLALDRENQIKVVSIFERCGFPTAKQIGSDGIYALFMVIQHASQKLQEKYFPYFKERADFEELDRSTLALMEDRILLGQGKKQIYGTQYHIDPISKKYIISPLENPNEVNKRRAAVGLGTLEDYLEKINQQQ